MRSYLQWPFALYSAKRRKHPLCRQTQSLFNKGRQLDATIALNSSSKCSNRGRCRACAKPYCLLRLRAALCSLRRSMFCRVVLLSCASVASRSPLPLLCMAMSSALGSQFRALWRGSAASKYAAPRCDREWVASVSASWSEAGYSGDVAVMGRRGGPRVLRWASAPGR